jgi:uncharacterized protein YjdB
LTAESVPNSNASTPTPTPTPTPVLPTPSKPVVVGGDIRFEKERMQIKKGTSFSVAATLPKDFSLTDFTWMSSDETIAKVDEQGKVTTLKTGYAMIAAVSFDGSYFDYLQLDVVSFDTEVSKISFEKSELSVAIGTTTELKVVCIPETAPLSNLTFSSSNPEIATVDETGKLTALQMGTTTVTVTAPNGQSASLAVTVREVLIKVSSIKLDKSTAELKAGQSLLLTATVLPENAENKTLLFRSSDPAVATVEKDGTVLALKKGTVTITAYSHDEKVSDSCTITVTQPDDPMDGLSYAGAIFDSDQGGYEGGIRIKSTDEIMFSPNLPVFRKLVSSEKFGNYVGYIRFTALLDGKELTFPSVQIVPKKAKGDWVDFFMMGDDIDCGFCPTEGVSYRIEFALVEKKSGKVAYYSEFEEMTAPKDLSDSPYYKPTAGGSVRPVDPDKPVTPPDVPGIPTYTLTYKAVGGGILIGELSQTLTQGKQGTAVIAFPLPGYRFNNWSDGLTDPVRQGDYAYADAELGAYFSSEKGELIPTINITTSSGRPIQSKEYETATMVISGAKDSKYNITATLQIRGRGNSSWNGSAPQSSYDSKNSYRIKLDEKDKLLGVGDGKNKDWVLNSNKFDLSGLRNKVVWDFAERMGTMTYVTECTWVQLYINNEYRGMYMLTELVEIANERVNIDETITKSEDKGYLLEIDFRGNYEDTPYFYIDGYGKSPTTELHSAREFVIKNDNVTDEDVAYIKSYIEKCHAAFMSGNKEAIEELVDLPSLIDMYILEELGKDVDVGAASFFLHKKEGGKLYFTAPWDFDFGFGTYGPGTSTWGLVSEGNDGCDWFAELINHKWFCDMVTARMDELRPHFEATIKAIETLGVDLEGAADMNANHWDMYGNKFHSYVSSGVSSNLYSYQEHIEFLVEWTTERYDNLYDTLINYY